MDTDNDYNIELDSNDSDESTPVWIDITDIAEQIGWQAMRRHNVARVRPVTIERAGTFRVTRNPIHDELENTIRCICSPSDERKHFDYETQICAEYSGIMFDTTAIVEWMQQHAIAVPSQWQHYCSSKPSQAPKTVSYDELRALTGRSSPADVKAWLVSYGIQFYEGKRGRPFTMLSAMEHTLGIDLNTVGGKANNKAKLPTRKIEV